ncbi:MAG TPA: hypothetical protein VEK08_17420 [Planctomycetota bacterium]|nr:hypothetical protein [Planctomycetota bacterium]
MGLVYILGVVFVLGVISFFYRVWEQDEAIRLLTDWAKGNQYAIVDAVSRRWADRPGHISSSMLQMVFRIKIKDAGGREREGWVRIGSYFSGLLSKQVDVFWDSAV